MGDSARPSDKAGSEDCAADLEKNAAFFAAHARMLPAPYAHQESNKMTLAYFAVGGLALLQKLDSSLQDRVIEWVYRHQVDPFVHAGALHAGFRGSEFLGLNGTSARCVAEDYGHSAMNYTALALLLLCGDDLSRVRRNEIIESLRSLQQEDGSFTPHPGECEADLRMVYCACVTSYILDDWRGVDRDRALGYIQSCAQFDGGFGLRPGDESHGGAVYCAVASAVLMGRIDALDADAISRWCIFRQDSGFQGRINKPPDSCYGFWIGASLHMLGNAHFVQGELLRGFLACCASEYGGFSKEPGAYPDVLHSYMTLSAYRLFGDSRLASLDPVLGLPVSAVSRLHEIHAAWRSVR